MPMMVSVLSACMKILSIVLYSIPLSGELRQIPLGARPEGKTLMLAPAQPQTPGERDHCAVIGAEFRPRKIQPGPGRARDRRKAPAQPLIGSDATGHHHSSMAGGEQRPPRLLGERLDHRFFEAARNVSPPRLIRLAAS